MKRKFFTMCAVLTVLSTSQKVCAESPPTFVAKWGTFGTGNGQFNKAVAVVTAKQDYLYAADLYNHRIEQFTKNGVFVRQFGTPGSGNGQFQYPTGVAIDTLGNVYVVDSTNNRIEKFSPVGVFIGKFGSLGEGNGEFANPQSIAVSPDNFVYVADTFNDRIQKFTSAGAFVLAFGSNGTGPGQFSYPTGIACNSQGHVYVCDMFNDRIEIFTGNGEYLGEFGSTGAGAGQMVKPFDVTVDSHDMIYVADSSNNRIEKFTAEGTWVLAFGTEGAADGQFKGPQGVDVDIDGYIYVADTANNRIEKFAQHPNPVTLTTLSAERVGDRVVLRWEVNEEFTDEVGFRIFRGNTELTSTPLRGERTYEFVDTAAPRGALTYWLQEVEATGDTYRHGPINVVAAAPLALSLLVHPNPFNPGTTLRYVVPNEERVTIAVYSVSGRPIVTLVDRTMQVGQYEYRYEPRLPSGIYFVRLMVGKQRTTTKIVLLQ